MVANILSCLKKYYHSVNSRQTKQEISERLYAKVARLLLILVVLSFNLSVFAQGNKKNSKDQATDTVVPDLFSMLKKMGKDEAAKSVIKYEENRIALKQDELISEIKKTTQKAKAYLKRGIDTAEIKTELENILKWLVIAGDGIFTKKTTIQTHRNLITSSKLIKELLKKANVQKVEIDKYEKDLTNFRSRLDSLSSDSALYTFSTDSVIFTSYFQKLSVASLETKQPDSALKNALKNVQDLQAIADLTVNRIYSEIEELDNLEKELSDKAFKREFTNIGVNKELAWPYSDIFHFSLAKDKLTLLFYIQNNWGKLFFVLAMIALLTFFLTSLRQKLKQQEQPLLMPVSGHLILRNTLLSSIIIVLNLFQFIFSDPPFIFSILLWLISATSLTIIFRGFITRYWMFVWLTMFLLFIFASTDNLILEASATERWVILLLSLTGVIAGSLVLLWGNKNELKEKWILYFIGLAVLLEAASTIANIYGRYNLSKNMMTAGYFNVIIGILFLWTIRLINEGLSIASQIYTGTQKKLFYINFERVGTKVPPLFHLLVIIGWFILFGRNFYSFKLISEPLKNFFLDERTIGNYTFTINNVVVFFMIMAVSVIISKIVSFFASDQHRVTSLDRNEKKSGVGSWLLLIRISIISMGLFLAFAAAGIPMDRITIILGALGVGIGLGLQALVNNLVSGLIIAFEKPVNVGDIVEIGGKTGTMKSIGFRSSVIYTGDGADMIIPNGDLLNAHLVNWTLSGSMRRVEILVGVAYKTDLEKTKQILNELFLTDERILKTPAPSVVIKEFNNTSIDIMVLFWVNKYGDWLITKSDMISAIDITFNKHGIHFPEQDIYIKESPDVNKGNK